MAEAVKSQYDAIILVSFGGPEGLDDVLPFLENVLRGKNVPRERMMVVAEHYEQFGGVSPINDQNRALIGALVDLLNAEGPHLPVYWGNRNWHPLLGAALQQMADDGVQRALAFVTSAYSSYSGCRQYLENIEQAREPLGPEAPQIDKIRAYYNHPGFIEPNVENLRRALSEIPVERRSDTQVLFTAHSIPQAMNQTCKYEAQLQEVCRLVGQGAGHSRCRLVYQSRSGPPQQPWLEPDVCDTLRELAAADGTRDVVIAPVGFISDHLEVQYDLDTEAQQVCDCLGLNMIRASTVGTHGKFIQMIRQLILERIDSNHPRLALGDDGPGHDVCGADCCLYTPGRPAAV